MDYYFKSLIIIVFAPGVRCYLLDELFREVFAGYQSATRPLCLKGAITEVNIDFALRQIVDLDEPRQFLNSILWVRMEWADCRLRWNESMYDGLNEIILPQNKVWVPDLTLYDNSAAEKLSGIEDYNLVVHSNGVVNYNFPSVIRSVCSIDVTHFPFDYQACNLTFGSWAYSGKQLDVINVSIKADMASYVLNSEWHVYTVPVDRIVTFYGEIPYPTLVVRLLLKRRPLFYAMNLLFPCFLISSVAVLGFLLPPASGEKVNLEITVLLSLAVFQLIVLELMPPSGTVSFMGLYFIISMVLVGFSCFATVVVLNIHFKGSEMQPLPNWVRRCLFNPLARIMCVNIGKETFQIHSIPKRRRKSSDNEGNIPEVNENGSYRLHAYDEWTPARSSVNENGSHKSRVFDESIASGRSNVVNGIELNEAKTQNCLPMSKQLVSLIEQIGVKLESINRQLEAENEQFHAGHEWRTFALVLDRLFMSAYILFLLCSCLSLSLSVVVMNEVPAIWSGETL